MRRGPDGRRGVARLAALLYPFVAAAMAINIFLLGLMGQAAGLPVLTPVASLVLGIVTGIPATWLAGRWLRSLIEEADDGS